MGYSRDGNPWAGGVPGRNGVWVCAGYTGHGDVGPPPLILNTLRPLTQSGMPNAPLAATHVAALTAAAVGGKDWRVVEREAVSSGNIPSAYVLTRERMCRAREMPPIQKLANVPKRGQSS